MTALINSLPDRQGKAAGMLQVVDKESTKEDSLCFTDYATKVKAKNWQAQSYQSNAWFNYADSKVPTSAITSSATTDGMVATIGVPDLTKVPYDIELTIVAMPTEGYKFTALAANSTDILASKRVAVKEAVEVKATFAEKSFAVTFNRMGEGTITVTGTDNLSAMTYDTELTIVATPAAGYDLQSLVVGGIDIAATKGVIVKDNVTVTATFAKKNFTATLEEEGEGTITTTGANDLNLVACGTELTINTTPAIGCELVSITVNGTNITTTKEIVVKNDLTTKATFAKKSFVVSLTKEGESMITATGASNLNPITYGTELTIVTTPAAGHELVSITAGGTDITASRKVVVTGSLTVRAASTRKNFAVSLTKEGEGIITATGASNLSSVAYDTELTINAIPAEGYELVFITAGGTDITATKKIVVKDNMTVKATFTKRNFAVSPTKEGEGAITVTDTSNPNSVTYDAELTINATPAEGYELTAFTASSTDILATKKIVIKDDLTIKAAFTKKSFTASLTREGEGTISATGAGNLSSIAYDTELTINATPAGGYELVPIMADGTDITTTKRVVVAGNLTITATFTKNNFAVSLTKEDEGTIAATDATSLNAATYGTELTIVATPAAGCGLVSITAGDTDITASKKVVVTGNLTVKTAFAKKGFAISLTKEDRGTVIVTGASSLNAVVYDTELTINATSARGYELVPITASGTDITASKKVVVTGSLTVKAIFAKKSFAASLIKEGEGATTATGASNPDPVAYGTKLTIIATPAEGYELTVLTTNGTNILATRKIVIEGSLAVKATFAKKSFAVSLAKEGEDAITATGTSDLNSVAYGTELTVVTTPAEGYELTVLTTDGADVLATKGVIAEGNLTVKATLMKKTFAVTLTSNEHGDITIVEPVSLEAMSYDTTLTVKTTGKNAQCELTALTVSGKDTLAIESSVVTNVTEVKTTSVDHTGVGTTVMQQVQLYSNPATDYVIVEGVASASEVTLHSVTGNRLYAGHVDSRGMLQIDLTPYAGGVYLVCVTGETYQVVVGR